MISFICEHPGVIMEVLALLGGSILALLAGLGTLLSWLYRKDLATIGKQIGEVKVAVEAMVNNYLNCQKDMPIKFVTRHEFEMFLEGRKEDWSKFTAEMTQLLIDFKAHRHDENGDVK